MRAAVPEGSALVSLVRYDRTVFNAPAQGAAASRPRASRTVPSYLAFVLRPNRQPTVVPLGSALTIERLVPEWRAAIAAEAVPAAQPTNGEPVRASRVSGGALRRLVWDPLVPHLGDATRIFVVPDGVLNLVPLVALPVGQRSYLIDNAPVIHYLSAERDLVPGSADDTPPIGQGLLALGGPTFDDPTLFGAGRNRPASAAKPGASATRSVRLASANCASIQSVKFGPLQGTLQEVRELSQLWAAPTVPAGEESRILVGRDASEPTLKKEAHRYRVLHLATHGFFLGESCSPVLPGTRAVDGLVGTPGTQAAVPAENPLLLSGLALAGANRRQLASATEDDGILTAEEVASLDLGGVEWAVLSACDTGVGQIKTGEGVFGLRRAFQVAGARTVLMSLWSVDDQATRLWMRALYEAASETAYHSGRDACRQRRRTAGPKSKRTEHECVLLGRIRRGRQLDVTLTLRL